MDIACSDVEAVLRRVVCAMRCADKATAEPQEWFVSLAGQMSVHLY